jgi:hypothetical protein
VIAIVLGAVAGWAAAVPLYEWAIAFVTSGSGVYVFAVGSSFEEWMKFSVAAAAAGALVAGCSAALALRFRRPASPPWRTASCAAALLPVFVAAAYVALLSERRTWSFAAPPPGAGPGTGTVTVPIESVRLWPALLAGGCAVVAATLIVAGLRRPARRVE